MYTMLYRSKSCTKDSNVLFFRVHSLETMNQLSVDVYCGSLISLICLSYRCRELWPFFKVLFFRTCKQYQHLIEKKKWTPNIVSNFCSILICHKIFWLKTILRNWNKFCLFKNSFNAKYVTRKMRMVHFHVQSNIRYNFLYKKILAL